MDHRKEMNHLSPKASYLGSEGLPKEENEQQNLLTATAYEVLLPTYFFLFYFKGTVPQNIVSFKSGHIGGMDL